VSAVLFVLGTDAFQNVRIRLRNFDAEWLGVRLGIIEINFGIDVPEITLAIALRHMQGFAAGMKGSIEPCFIVESNCFHYQRLAFPPAC